MCVVHFFLYSWLFFIHLNIIRQVMQLILRIFNELINHNVNQWLYPLICIILSNHISLPLLYLIIFSHQSLHLLLIHFFIVYYTNTSRNYSKLTLEINKLMIINNLVFNEKLYIETYIQNFQWNISTWGNIQTI